MSPAEIYIDNKYVHTIPKAGGGYQHETGINVQYNGDYLASGSVSGPKGYADSFILGMNQESLPMGVPVREVAPIEKGEPATTVNSYVKVKIIP